MNYILTEAQRQQLLDAFDSVAGKGKRCESGMTLLQSLATTAPDKKLIAQAIQTMIKEIPE